MSRIVKVETENHKEEIVNFINTGNCPGNMDNNQKKTFRKKCAKFKVVDGILKYSEDGYLKTVIAITQVDNIYEIILDKHNLDHSGAMPTFDRVKEEYVGITVDDIKMFIR